MAPSPLRCGSEAAIRYFRNSEECSLCQAGTYSNAGATACILYPYGVFSDILGSTSASLSIQCAAGTYSSASGASSQQRCQDCEVGTYQGNSGQSHCVECPANTYGEQKGAKYADQCVACPSDKTSTRGKIGQKYNTSCLCNDEYYRIKNDTTECQRCPPGLKCFGNETVAPRVLSSIWDSAFDITIGYFYNLSYCPGGYSYKYPSTFDATVLSAQQCLPCDKGEECTSPSCSICSKCKPGYFKSCIGPDDCSICAQDFYMEEEGSYSCHPCPLGTTTRGSIGVRNVSQCVCDDNHYKLTIGDACQPCPRGLICYGNSSFEPKPLAYGFSQWDVADDGRTLRLTYCPAGYYLAGNLVEPSSQECVVCGQGQDCNSPPCAECSLCLPGSYKASYQSFSLPMPRTIFDNISKAYTRQWIEDPCESCPPNTFRALTGGTEVGACLACPDRSTTEGRSGSSSIADCKCQAFYYPLVSTNSSSISKGVQCETCPKGAVCASDRTCALRNPPLFECPIKEDQIIGTWSFEDITGAYVLQSCPAGYSKVSSEEASPALQECAPCLPGTYIIYPDSDRCQKCPKGATCPGSGVFLETVAGSKWEIETSESSDSVPNHVFRIVECPAGYTLRREQDYPLTDECQICPTNTYLLIPTRSKDTECLPCPVGAECPGGSEVHALPGFWQMPKVTGSRRQENEITPAQVFQCPLGACGDGNNCSGNRVGPVCGLCPQGWAKTTQGCQECPSSAVLAPLRGAVAAIFAIVGSVVYILRSWFAFVPDFVKKIARMVISCISGMIQDSNNNEPNRFSGLINMIREFWRSEHRARLFQYIKILISFFQVFSSFVTFQINWPALLLNTMAWLKGTVFLDILMLPGLACLWNGVNFTSRLYAYTLGPLLLFVALTLPVLVVYIVQACRKQVRRDPTSDHDEISSSDASTLQGTVLDSYWKNLMFALFLLYPVVSLTSLQAFDCQPRGLGLLAADYNQPCPANNSFLRVYSIVFIILFPFGIPFFIYLVMITMGIPIIAQDKINMSMIAAMIHLFIKMTSTVESRQLAMLLGDETEDKAEFAARVKRIYSTLFGDVSMFNDRAISLGLNAHAIRHLIQSATGKHVEEVQLEDFDRMARELLQQTTLFTGAEHGDVLTRQQGLALLRHRWPESQKSEVEEPSLEDLVEIKENEDKNEKLNMGEKTIPFEFETDAALRKKLFNIGNNLIKLNVIALPTLEWHGAPVENGKIPKKSDSDLKDFIIHPDKEDSIEMGKLEMKWFMPFKVEAEWNTLSKRREHEFIAVRRIGFVFLAYKVEFWFWEMFEMFRKFLMTSVLVVVLYPGEPSQPAAGLAITMIFLVLNLTLKPYISNALNRSQNLTLMAHWITLFLGIMLIIDVGQLGLESKAIEAGKKFDLAPRTAASTITFVFNMIVVAWPLFEAIGFELAMSTLLFVASKAQRCILICRGIKPEEDDFQPRPPAPYDFLNVINSSPSPIVKHHDSSEVEVCSSEPKIDDPETGRFLSEVHSELTFSSSPVT